MRKHTQPERGLWRARCIERCPPGSGSGPGKRASRKADTAPRADFHRPPQPLICAFIDEMRAEGYAVESVLRVLRQQGVGIAARTYRSWKSPTRIAARTVTDALVEGKIRELAWTHDEASGRRRMTPEGLYGRRKWTALLRRQQGLAGTSRGAVDRAMRALGLEGIRRAKKLRTTIADPDGKRAGDLLNRDFTAVAPNLVWVTDFERHEALLNRAVVKGHRLRSVAADRVKLRAA